MSTVELRNSQAAVPTDASSQTLRIEIWEAHRREAALLAWRSLESRLQSNRLTSSSLWTETWLKHYGSQVRYRFAVGCRGGTVVGIALLTESNWPEVGPLFIRTWHVGTAGEASDDAVCIEFNSLLVRPADRDEFIFALQRAMLAHADCDAVSWDGFHPGDLPQGFTSSSAWRTRVRPTYYYDLRKARDISAEPISLLGDSTRKGIRQNLRAAKQLEVQWSETVDQALQHYDELIRLHQARWNSAGEPGSFASDRFRKFHAELLTLLVPRGQAAVVRVQIASQTVGCNLIYFDRNRALLYQGGWSGEKLLKSPGLVNDFSCISECLRRGYDAYDFMAGDSIHKQRLTTDQDCLIWSVHCKTMWKFQALDRLRSAKKFWRTFGSRLNGKTPPTVNKPPAGTNPSQERPA